MKHSRSEFTANIALAQSSNPMEAARMAAERAGARVGTHAFTPMARRPYSPRKPQRIGIGQRIARMVWGWL